jgi:hypothetical protein
MSGVRTKNLRDYASRCLRSESWLRNRYLHLHRSRSFARSHDCQFPIPGRCIFRARPRRFRRISQIFLRGSHNGIHYILQMPTIAKFRSTNVFCPRCLISSDRRPGWRRPWRRIPSLILFLKDGSFYGGTNAERYGEFRICDLMLQIC